MSKLTIKAKVTDDSRHKLEALGREYHAFQAYLHADKTVNLYSATRQQADRLLARIKRPKKGRQYPLILRRDRINVQNDSKFPNTYWMKIPIYPKSIHVRIRADSRHDLTQYQLREAKVIRQRDDWYVFLCIEKESPSPKQPTSILAIDLGVRHIAVTTNTANTRPNFYGHKLRLIRGFHFWLRRKLGQKKAFHKIKELKDREFLQVNHELHQISKAIVEEANRTNSVIVVGKVKGIRQKLNAGRRIRRLVNNFPYFRLVQYIKYKAEWAGVRVMDISEAHTSQTCHNCFNRSRTARKTQGLYRCTNCGREFNADENGSRNILQRALGVLSNVGGLLTCRIEPLVIAERSKVITEEPLTPSVGRMSETKERNEIGERFD
jgi:IS605 OrfB family transposase